MSAAKKHHIPRYQPGDTHQDSIRYDCDTLVVVNGKAYKRHFRSIYCKNPECGEFIPAKFILEKTGVTRIIGQDSHNRLSFCSNHCGSVGRRKHFDTKVHSNTKHEFGFPVIAWSKLQDLKYKLYVARL